MSIWMTTSTNCRCYHGKLVQLNASTDNNDSGLRNARPMYDLNKIGGIPNPLCVCMCSVSPRIVAHPDNSKLNFYVHAYNFLGDCLDER
jgi:hypothetical protein